MDEKKDNKMSVIVLTVTLLFVGAIIYFGFLGEAGNKSLSNLSKQEEESGLNSAVKSIRFKRFPHSSNIGDMAVGENYIWIANGAGLVRLDKSSGKQKVYTEADGLIGNQTREVIKHGNEVWVASQSQGISILNKKDGSWRYYTPENGLVSAANPVMKLDGDRLWLGTFRGLGMYDFKKEEWTNWKEGAGSLFSGVDDLVYDRDYVWIYVSPDHFTKGGVFRLDKQTFQWQDIEARGLSNFRTQEEYDGKYWEFDEKGNIVATDMSTGSKKVIDINPLENRCANANNSIDFNRRDQDYRQEFNFGDDSLWFGCMQGVVRYGVDDKEWSFIETASNYPADIYDVFTVKDGVLVANTNLGLGLLNPQKKDWSPIKTPKKMDFLEEKAIWMNGKIYFVEIEEMNMGISPEPYRLWVYDIEANVVQQVEVPEKISIGNILTGVTLNNNLWFRAEKGIQEYDLRSKKVTLYRINTSSDSNFIIRDPEDVVSNNNILWFVSNFGLGNIDQQIGVSEIIGNPPTTRNFGWVLENLVVVEDEIWADAVDVHDKGKGLHIYHKNRRSWRHLTSQNSGLKFNKVKDLVRVGDHLVMPSVGFVERPKLSKHDLFVRTTTSSYVYERHGVNVFNLRNKQWEFYTSEDGMLDGEPQKVLVDDNEVWMVNDGAGAWVLGL